MVEQAAPSHKKHAHPHVAPKTILQRRPGKGTTYTMTKKDEAATEAKPKRGFPVGEAKGAAERYPSQEHALSCGQNTN